jgi:hypothetical protein
MRVGAADEALARTRGYLCGGRLELVFVPPLTTALALRPRAPCQHRSIETRPQIAPRVRVGVLLWWRQNSNAGEWFLIEDTEQKPRLWGKEEPAAALRCTRHRQACAVNLPTPPRMPSMARGACSAMLAFAQALTLAPREMLQSSAQFGVQRLEISSKQVNECRLRTVACRGL